MLIGIDTGGTFTDLIYHDGRQWVAQKRLSTPADPAEAVISGLQAIRGARKAQIVHGSTVATNAVLEKKGARTALVTNAGFEDVIAIGRQRRENLYDLKYRKKPPLVDETLRFGVSGRINAQGAVLAPIDEDEIRRLARQLVRSGIESVAVSCLFAFANPAMNRGSRKYFRPWAFRFPFPMRSCRSSGSTSAPAQRWSMPMWPRVSSDISGAWRNISPGDIFGSCNPTGAAFLRTPRPGSRCAPLSPVRPEAWSGRARSLPRQALTGSSHLTWEEPPRMSAWLTGNCLCLWMPPLTVFRSGCPCSTFTLWGRAADLLPEWTMQAR